MDRTLLKDGMTRWVGSMVIMLLAVGAFGSQQALAQINLTKHNLGSAHVVANTRFDGTAEICVFCHTPYGADKSAATPLWNRDLAAAITYTTYNSLGTSSQDGASAPVGSVSITCLSCHDGGQAMNVMINTPRSALAGAWNGNNPTLAEVTGGNISNIDVNFRSDHPFGNRYAGGAIAADGPPAAPGIYLNTQMRDPDYSSAQSAIVNGQTVWWIDTPGGTAGVRDKTDIQLYTRVAAPVVSPAGVVTAGTVTGPEPFIECASCHDPHTAANSTFLRIVNTGSAVCLACHSKK